MWLSSNQPNRPPRRRVSHATVVAYVALVVAALGIPATAVATTALVPRNSVGTAQLRDGAVTNPKIRNGEVGNAKLRNHSVGNAKLRDRSVGRDKMRTGAVTNRTIADNAVTRRNVNVSTLPLVGIAVHFSAAETPVPIGQGIVLSDPTGLGPGTYRQPAHTLNTVVGRFSVSLPPGADDGCAAPGAVLVRADVVAGAADLASGARAIPTFRDVPFRLGGIAITPINPTPTINTTNGPATRTLTVHVFALCTTAAGGEARPVGAELRSLDLWILRGRGAVPSPQIIWSRPTGNSSHPAGG